MKSVDVAALVTERASRFGDRNQQQFKQLLFRLGKQPEVEVAKGLLSVFTEGAVPPVGTAAQELAGKLLLAIRPKVMLDLGVVLRAALGRYELSVEQFPLYLHQLFGGEQVLEALRELETGPLSQHERRAAETMRFWLRAYREMRIYSSKKPTACQAKTL